ncbi:DNA adenine methylase [Chloroflexota bacterium]
MTVSQKKYVAKPESESLTRDAKPFLKWAGGKQQLIKQYESYFPPNISRYFEPFIGGGAVFFHLWNTGKLNSKTCLFDNNETLVNTYIVVRDRLDELIEALSVHKEKHCQEYYYLIRNLERQKVGQNNVERAARTIYLNKTCYNGLYRVNSKGQFNVPMGRYKNPGILNEDLLRAASVALQDICIEVRDFRSVIELSQAGDFFYFDPPYDPKSKIASFTGYTAGNFQVQDQYDLADVFTQLTAKGCLCMLSNSHTPLILDLYRHFKIEVVQANRAINSDANGRGIIKEVVVLNY